MSKPLQNVKTVKELLTGTHRTQTKKSISIIKDKNFNKEVLETFEDGTPKVWIETNSNGVKTKVVQHDGFRTKEPVNSILASIQEKLRVPENCPCCQKNMRDSEKRLNFKFWFKRKKCFDCVLKEETLIRQKGPEAWKSYENQVMAANAESWFQEADTEVDLIKSQIKETFWQNADGEQGQVDIENYIKKIESDYNNLKLSIREQFNVM